MIANTVFFHLRAANRVKIMKQITRTVERIRFSLNIDFN